MRTLAYTLTLLLLPLCAWAGGGEGEGVDVAKVEALLREGASQGEGTNLMLFYGHRLEGTPYVAGTLEVNSKERLVVNLREMDCTTFVETCLALTLTTREGSTRYDDYCRNLTRIRYRQGVLAGYASRNHYFSQWIGSNEALGIVREVREPAPLFAKTQVLDLHYMSTHPQAYPMLRGDREALRLIRQHEGEGSGQSVSYIPKDFLAGDSTQLTAIRDGDILALVTSKDGLDVSHLGLAEWGGDGCLHLLNASQTRGKVVLEPMTLHTYMSRHPSQLGVRVIRLITTKP